MPMTERDVLRMLLASADAHSVEHIASVRGHAYTLTMEGKPYSAVLLVNSFDFYTKGLHLSAKKPTLVICYTHDTVLPVACLSLRAGNYATPYAKPEGIGDVAELRGTQRGSKLLLGMCLIGMREGQDIVNALPLSTRNRYYAKIHSLARRKAGRPMSV